MKIVELLTQPRPTLSFEVFPPKTQENFDSVERATSEIAAMHPSYMSITYGAAGTTSGYTIDIADRIRQRYDVPVMVHLTCVTSTREKIRDVLRQLRERNIENVLALRGDIPTDIDFPLPGQYRYASELIEQIRVEDADLCIGAACYPEGHIESANRQEDLRHLKEKVDAGCDFLTTQMFFDNSILYNFLYRARDIGITVPVVPGIMPVTNGKQIARICSLSGTHLPARFQAIVDKFGDRPDAMQQAGIAYATEQIVDLLANGIEHIHVYSMNKPQVAQCIQQNLSRLIGGVSA